MPLSEYILLRGTFSFGDREMERRYQRFYISSSIDRLRPFLCYLVIPSRLSLLVYEELHAPEWVRAKILFIIMRLCIFTTFLALLSKKWGKEMTYWRGLALLWTIRMSFFLIALEHSSTNYGGIQSMASPVMIICFSGLAVPSFIEYIFSILPISILGPLQLYLHSSSTETIFSVLYQHTLILALGASVTWTVHADHRRDWLRSRTARVRAQRSSGQLRGDTSGPESVDIDSTAATSSASKAATGGADWDDFIAADSTEMRELARQVPCPMHSVSLSQSCRRWQPEPGALHGNQSSLPMQHRNGCAREGREGQTLSAAATARRHRSARQRRRGWRSRPTSWRCGTAPTPSSAPVPPATSTRSAPRIARNGLATTVPCGGQCATGAMPLVRAWQPARGPGVQQTPLQHTNVIKVQHANPAIGSRLGHNTRLAPKPACTGMAPYGRVVSDPPPASTGTLH